MTEEKIIHPFEPIFDEHSEILILGSFPSVRSRQNEFYYGHERNRFWQIISMLFNEPVPQTIEQKKLILIRHNIALWDVAQSCNIHASSDSSIRNVIPNDLSALLNKTKIKKIYANGKTAESLYNRLIYSSTGIPITVLPSTSPANAAFTFEKLIAAWNIIKEN